MRAKKVYESIGNILRGKSMEDVKRSINDPNMEYWFEFIKEWNKLFDEHDAQPWVLNGWFYNPEKQYRVLQFETFLGRAKIITEWGVKYLENINEDNPIMGVEIGTSRKLIGNVDVKISPKELALNVLTLWRGKPIIEIPPILQPK